MPTLRSLIVSLSVLNLGSMVSGSTAITGVLVVVLTTTAAVFVASHALLLSERHAYALSVIYHLRAMPTFVTWFLVLGDTMSYLVRVLSVTMRLVFNVAVGHTLLELMGSEVCRAATWG